LNTKDKTYYYRDNSKCEKCKESEAVIIWGFGWAQIPGGSRWIRNWHLCMQCLQNAKIATEGKQWPMYDICADPVLEDGKPVLHTSGPWKGRPVFGRPYLKNTGKTTWGVQSGTYGPELSHPGARRNAIDA
jgi:hypothetical protein